jgi:NAD-dependent DNA ligase
MHNYVSSILTSHHKKFILEENILDKDKVYGRIVYLRRVIKYHNYRYYELNSPVVSDYEFDKLFKELQNLEQENPEFFDIDSPTQTVGY